MSYGNSIYQLRTGKSLQLTSYNYKKSEKTIKLLPGEKKIIVDHQGTGIINRLWLTFPGWFWQWWNPEAKTDQTILKRMIIRVFYDNEEFPSIESPVGDFFGIGHCEYRHYTSRYLGMSSGGFYSYLPMPFKKGIKIEFENTHDDLETVLFFNANLTSMKVLPHNTGYLHCQYSSGNNDGKSPMVILETEGNGHFCGCCLSIQGKNRAKMFFLEAPEFICIDGEDTPSIYGTGMEDYFNGGWYFRDGEYCSELHGIPIKDPINAMVSMYRFHEDDAIIFNKKIKMYFDNPMKNLDLSEFKFSSTSYYYLDKPMPLSFLLPEKENLVSLYRFRETDHISVP